MAVSIPRRSGKHAQRPEMFETWTQRFPKTNGGIAAAVTALVEGYKNFYDHHRKVSSDQTSTEGARLVKSAKAARTKVLPLIERLDAASVDAATHMTQLQASIRVAYDPPNKTYEMCMRHAEIRAHLKSLPHGDRFALVEAARKAGDEDTLVAVASYQGFLSGMEAERQKYFRDYLVEAHAPQEAAMLQAMGEQRQLAEELRQTVLQSLADLIDFNKADELIAAANDELAA